MNQFLAENLVLITYSLFVSWVIISIPFLLRNRSPKSKLIAAVIIFLAARFIPIFESYSLAYIMFGAFGNLSIVSLLLIICFIYAEINHNNEPYKINSIVFLILLILSAVLYLSVFGYITEDIYSWGYYPTWMLGLYLIIQIAFSIKSKLFAILWLIALIAFIFKIQVSINLWDYMFDPLLISISIFYLLIFIISRIIKTCFPSRRIKPSVRRRLK